MTLPVRPEARHVVAAAVDAAFAVGMHQHRGEIEPFAAWLCERWPHHVLEIGGLHGGTAALWAALATGRIISVDLPGGRFGGADHGYDVAKCTARNARLAELTGGRFAGILGDSHTDAVEAAVVDALAGELVDLLFIDGDHTLEGVREDFERYRQFVRPGGAVAFHDIEDTPLHRAAGCVVSDFWSTLEGETRVFSIGAAWGGIGVLRHAG